MEKEETTLSQKLDRVLSILENDDRTGRKGLVHLTEENKIAIANILERERTAEAVKKGQMVIYGAVGGFCIWLLTVVAKLIFPFLLKFV